MKNPTRREILQSAAGVGLAVVGQSSFGQFDGFMPHGLPLPLSRTNPAVQHIEANCVECGRCRDFCNREITVFGFPVPDGEDECIHCGQCTLFCMTDALAEQYHYPLVAKAIANPEKIVIASTSPAIRVALGEMFNMKPGTNVEAQTVGALRKLGVDYVLDTAFGADLTVMEEASELLRRLETKDDKDFGKNSKHPLPMFTSCCPAWVRFAELFYPKLLAHISTTKSPVLIQGAVTKTYFAQKRNLDPKKIFHVALTPCTAKKAEILLPGMNASGVFHGNSRMRDIDVALTTRELAYLLNDAEIKLHEMPMLPPESAYDSLMGEGSGGGMIFGNTGGVMEAALRTAYRLLNEKNPPPEFFELQPIRGTRRIREASVNLGRRKLNVAVVHGVGDARPFFEAVQNGEENYDFIEVMACSGGCIGGGGQPFNNTVESEQLRRLRMEALYRRDAESKTRLSCENPEIKAIYADFLDKPLGEMPQKLLHQQSELQL